MKLLVIAAGIILCAWALAGCGGDKGSAPPTTSSAAATHPTPSGDQRPGTLTVQASYLFSKAVGVKPDSGAIVLLVPEANTRVVGFLYLMDNPNARLDLAQDGGVYLKLADTGHGTITGIPPNRYICYLISEHSWSDAAEHDANVQMMRSVVGDWESVANKEVWRESVDIEPAQTAEITHVFGK